MRKTTVRRQPYNPEISAKLKEIASLLPILKRKRDVLRVLTGEQLLSMGLSPDFKTSDGSHINPKKHYSIPVEDIVDHYKELRVYYARYGWPGVEAYKKEVIELTLKSYGKSELPANTQEGASAGVEESKPDKGI